MQGFDLKEGGGIMLISHLIKEVVNIPVSVLMGANLAGEVADEKFCETTIGKPFFSLALWSTVLDVEIDMFLLYNNFFITFCLLEQELIFCP